MKTKLLAAGLLTSLTLTGCGDSESAGDITVTIAGDITNNTTAPVTDTTDVVTGLCAAVTEASFVSFNDDCSQAVATGTIDTDYSMASGTQYVLSGVVQVGSGNKEISSQLRTMGHLLSLTQPTILELLKQVKYLGIAAGQLRVQCNKQVCN